MQLGGPVWHASIKTKVLTPEHELRRMARKVLDGVGDRRLGEWEERHGAFHLRRRLSAIEAQMVGPVIDIRGTDEARRRAASLGDRLRYAPSDVLTEELGVGA